MEPTNSPGAEPEEPASHPQGNSMEPINTSPVDHIEPPINRVDIRTEPINPPAAKPAEPASNPQDNPMEHTNTSSANPIEPPIYTTDIPTKRADPSAAKPVEPASNPPDNPVKPTYTPPAHPVRPASSGNTPVDSKASTSNPAATHREPVNDPPRPHVGKNQECQYSLHKH